MERPEVARLAPVRSPGEDRPGPQPLHRPPPLLASSPAPGLPRRFSPRTLTSPAQSSGVHAYSCLPAAARSLAGLAPSPEQARGKSVGQPFDMLRLTTGRIGATRGAILAAGVLTDFPRSATLRPSEPHCGQNLPTQTGYTRTGRTSRMIAGISTRTRYNPSKGTRWPRRGGSSALSEIHLPAGRRGRQVWQTPGTRSIL